jgi:hypothetical protein
VKASNSIILEIFFTTKIKRENKKELKIILEFISSDIGTDDKAI